ncbi:MAG: PfkB family carbohydrate kinase [Tannerella sp.]|jgi:bifunctional ADP-heptose synthase (sugar kinase/adenylyltransferase)/phosphoglycolate phosphatase-like HAD superfamily hydrolase|nr:PfkB family carbohydrate kinase [Tannerella sp.]
MEQRQLETLLREIADVKIAIVGDFCLDSYWFIDESKSEISIETGQKTRPVRTQKYSLGGAGNVANNLAAMGVGHIYAVGVTGIDPFATEMKKIMQQAGIQTDYLLTQIDDWATHVYAKPYVGDNEEGRIDFGNFNQLSDAMADELLHKLSELMPAIDIVIINEQVLSGIHTPYFREQLVKFIGLYPEKKFIADSRHYNDYYAGCLHKMNDSEAARLCGLQEDISETVPYGDVCLAANILFDRFGKPVFITRGSYGSLVIDEQGIEDIPGLMIVSRVDTVGAGDSYLAGVAAVLGLGRDVKTAATLGSYVAGVTVQKLFQTGTASQEEILQIGINPDLIYEPDRAEDISMAIYKSGTEIEIINVWKDKRPIKYAIFDHDGTISTLREGWEHIMAPVMIRAILGEKYTGAGMNIYRKVEERVNEFIDKTTGIQTLVQMKGLVEMVREFGFVPENEILDEFGYKQIYYDGLMETVKVREQKYANGELSLEDLTVKNAIPFLEKLYNAGIQLILASGSDEVDVIAEARTLGYEHLFEGRIYGSVGDVTIEAKRIVLNRIMEEIGAEAFSQVVTFGDGPVEIRETRKRGGLTIGLATNELRRYGLNPDKRVRLIKAGADIIVPDFSQYPKLLELLNITI